MYKDFSTGKYGGNKINLIQLILGINVPYNIAMR